MIEGRISSEKVDTFCQQLAAIAGNHQELTTSPFLLSLMIEVYQKEDKIPTRRVELYEKQVTAIVSRCVLGKLKDDEDASGGLKDKKREVATQYLEVLAFVCQMRLSKRDFKLAECTSHVAERTYIYIVHINILFLATFYTLSCTDYIHDATHLRRLYLVYSFYLRISH